MPWIERIRNSQPIDAGIGLDGSNPITRELRLVWRGGNRIDDTMGEVASTVGTITNTLSRHGVGISPALNSYLSFPTAPSLDILGDITCLAIFSPSAVASDTSIVSNAFSNGGTYTPFDFGQNSAKLKLGRAGYNAGNYYRVWAAGTSTLTAGGLYTAVVTQTGGMATAPVFYVDGKKDTAASTSIYGGTGAGDAQTQFKPVLIGNRDDLATDFSGGIYLVMVWARALSESEAISISANPWQIFAKERIWVPVAAGGPTYTLTADSGSFALTGQATGLALNRVLSAASGSFALTGQAAGLAVNRTLSAASGSYSLTGQNATLTYTPTSTATYTLAAASGSFAVSGQDVVLAYNRVLSAANGSYLLTGQNATLVGPGLFTQAQLDYMLAYCQANMTGILKRWNGSAWV